MKNNILEVWVWVSFLLLSTFSTIQILEAFEGDWRRRYFFLIKCWTNILIYIFVKKSWVNFKLQITNTNRGGGAIRVKEKEKAGRKLEISTTLKWAYIQLKIKRIFDFSNFLYLINFFSFSLRKSFYPIFSFAWNF